MIKQSMMQAWDWFHTNTFMFAMDLNEQEINEMPEKLLIYAVRTYDIMMFMSFFFFITFGMALIYESLMYASIGYAPSNLIQFVPSYCLWIMITLSVYFNHEGGKLCQKLGYYTKK